MNGGRARAERGAGPNGAGSASVRTRVRSIGDGARIGGSHCLRMPDFRTLRAWQLAHELAIAVIEALPERTGRRVPGLRAQAIRSASSVAANLAEGCSRSSPADYLHFVEMALASLAENESELMLARDARLLLDGRYRLLARKVVMTRKLILGLQSRLREQVAEVDARTIHRTADAAGTVRRPPP